ncbi:G-type lectin S-receptor-like serine/threonine-protein kinase, partial [Tanacetum coccineum]
CVGFNSSNTNETGCIIWTGSNNFLANPRANSTLKYVINQNPISPNTAGNKQQKSKKWLWILISVVIALVFLCLGLLWCIKKRKHRQEENERRKRDKSFLELTASESFKDIHQLETDGGKGNGLLLFSFASIMAATDDFSLENKLGQGGFGPVYKGKLSDGREIAIKRLSSTSGQGLVEFKNELILIAKLQHTNLVRVLGCCIHREEKMLIYEYMPNKSLDFFLFDENKKAELNWPKRFNIIEGIAQGLLYLHKYSRMRVIHRDIKANNILLDESLNPKISDFGMARIFKENETEAMTNRVVGTYGYMLPEYAMEGTFSIKSDIFSFGVLILEIVSGRRNSSFIHLDRTFNLIEYAWELWQQGDAMELKDPTLGNTCVVQQFLRTVHVALLCVQESATDRPTTSDMISMLLNDTILCVTTQNKPHSSFGKWMWSHLWVKSKGKKLLLNNMTKTISVVEGR